MDAPSRKLFALLALAAAGCGGIVRSGSGSGSAAGGASGAANGGTAGAPADGSGGGAGDAASGPLWCGPGTKLCAGKCVGTADPAFGCSPTSCAPCTLPHATAKCTFGCAIAACDVGYGDCTPAPGCETDTDTDPDHCGFCINACVAGQSCSHGACL